MAEHQVLEEDKEGDEEGDEEGEEEGDKVGGAGRGQGRDSRQGPGSSILNEPGNTKCTQ